MSETRPVAVIVLAAGEGTRMKSATPKVLHPIGGRSLIHHALAAAAGTKPDNLIAVVRHERELVAGHIAGLDGLQPAPQLADQDDVKGTGRAVECGLELLDPDAGGTVVVSYGDVPLLATETMNALVDFHVCGGYGVSVLSARVADPSGYGRIVRSDDGGVDGIVEHKDASEAQRAITEINSGIYAFDLAVLRSALARVTTDNAQGEKYLTDVLALAKADGAAVAALTTDDVWQVEGANDRVQLAALGREMNRRVCEKWMRAGVTIVDPATTWISADTELAADVTLLPGVQLHGATTVETGAVIGPDTTLTSVEVGQRAEVVRTHGSLAVLGADVKVGPFAYLRPGTDLGARGKIGTFVETKNAQIGEGSKVPHLSYVGDASIGEESNIGAASVFVNYDGVAKHRTEVGSHVRTGSDNMFVAPVTVGDGAYSGAGTVIRKDVPPGALAINVAPQRNIEGWVASKRPGSPADEASRGAQDPGEGSQN
ncbi:bifunctional UDP-N-acetylglucosamine diphosphorylase/glucosamine-1-phosphate N-acetyltransferase GlmU [Spelaeicoccus albus]|uniref:Bifunctional protein GlmU n=1 Tax=Spelaeicoccus albus TaxID=1280376 RepID=A0A7Z0D2V7_9MICO|nr:bifunctional UDP-N-acetylglucosamine pyrophosphorylase/glucosamine-1-phosphate N-acetyltransferase [Spelaeicoccus albus]